MHTEHLQNVRVVWVAAGWLVAIAVTSLAVLVFDAAGFGVPGARNVVATAIAVMAGFAAGGFFAGFRAMRAPILHGVGMGVASVAVWALLNALGALLPGVNYTGVSAPVMAGLMLAQITAAVVGSLVGYNVALRGRPGLREGAPGE